MLGASKIKETPIRKIITCPYLFGTNCTTATSALTVNPTNPKPYLTTFSINCERILNCTHCPIDQPVEIESCDKNWKFTNVEQQFKGLPLDFSDIATVWPLTGRHPSRIPYNRIRQRYLSSFPFILFGSNSNFQL